MKATTLKALLLTILFVLVVGLNGCAYAPEEGPKDEQRSERKKAPERIMAPNPSRQPANDSDDMERLD